MERRMLLLAIDTSTATGSVALRTETGVTGVLTVSVDMTHSEGLMPAVDALLTRTGRSADELSALAAVTGPGSYTGLRIGIATAHGFAFPKRLPCVGISSLDVLSWVFPYAACPVCPLLEARKGWLYARVYEWREGRPRAITDELNVEPDELIEYIDRPTIFHGPGLTPYRESLQGMLEDQFVPVPSVYDLPRADLLADLAARELEAGRGIEAERLLPHYLGPSQAEVNWKKRQARSNSA